MRYEGLMTKIADFIGDNPGCSGRDIAGHMDISKQTLADCYEALQADGVIRKEGERNQARWFLVEV